MVEIKLTFDAATYHRYKRQADRQGETVEQYILSWARSGMVSDEDDDKELAQCSDG